VEWRRIKVLELLSKGNSQSEIAKVLQVDLPIISRDTAYLRQQSKENIKRYIDERLPEEYEKCLVGLNAILREAWNTSQHTEDRREKIQALSLAKECYSMKLDLLTNVAVVEDAIRFVSSSSSSSSVTNKEKAKAIDRLTQGQDNSSDDIQRPEEENQQQRLRYPGAAAATTTNQTF
jgi:hypothetical protein